MEQFDFLHEDGHPRKGKTDHNYLGVARHTQPFLTLDENPRGTQDNLMNLVILGMV